MKLKWDKNSPGVMLVQIPFQRVRILVQEMYHFIPIHQNTDFPHQVAAAECTGRRCIAGESGL